MRGRSAANEHVKARPSAARAPRVVGRAHAKVNLDLRVLGTRTDGYHELRTVFQTIDLCDTLTAQAEARPVRAEVPHARRAARRPESRVARRRRVVESTRPRRRAGRHRRHAGEGDPDAGRSGRRQRRCGGGAAGAGAPVGWCAVVAAAGGGGDGRLGCAVLPVGRHGARTRPRRGNLSARRSAAALGRHRPAAVRRVHRRGLHLVRRGSRRRRARAARRAADPAGALAVPRGADDQRSRAAGPAPAPGDWRDQDGSARSGGVRRGDVGERLGGIRAVPDASRRRPRPSSPGEDGARGLPQPHAFARRAREARPSHPAPRFDAPAFVPAKLNVF